MPSYMQPLAAELVNIRRQHATEFTRAVARSLRASALNSRRQGTLNINTVEGMYGEDKVGFSTATDNMSSLVERGDHQEKERLQRREELNSRSPTADEDIKKHLSGIKVAIRSYAGVVANDSPQGGAQNQGAQRDNQNPPGGNDNTQGNQDRMRRSRSHCRNNCKGNGRNVSRSPVRNCDNNSYHNSSNQRSQSRNKGRTANYGRNRQSNNRGNSRNRYHQRDSASEFMEKMFEFFQNR